MKCCRRETSLFYTVGNCIYEVVNHYKVTITFMYVACLYTLSDMRKHYMWVQVGGRWAKTKVCMCMYVYIHVYVHTYMYVYIHASLP